MNVPGNGSSRIEIEESCFAHSLLNSITIPRSVQLIGRFAFFGCTSLELVMFEAESHLKTIEDSCYCQCAMKFIAIPRSVEVLGKLCFAGAKLQDVTFEADSHIARIEARCFTNCLLRAVCLPPIVSAVAPDAFNNDVVVTIPQTNNVPTNE
jgi:hypothetical protein